MRRDPVMGAIVRRPSLQRGVVLFLALIILVAMSMAAISMFRAVDTGSMVAGNLSFKQSALLAADTAVEQARTWALANVLNLDQNSPANGYYALRQDALDIMGTKTPGVLTDDVDWNGSNATALAKAVLLPVDATTGNQAAFVVHRLCEIVGSINAPAQSCVAESMGASGSTQGAVNYSNQPLPSRNTPFFRVTVRVIGPRDAVSFVQATILP